MPFDIKNEAGVIRVDLQCSLVAFRFEVESKFLLNVSSLAVSVDFGLAVKIAIVNEERKHHRLAGAYHASRTLILVFEELDHHIRVVNEFLG